MPHPVPYSTYMQYTTVQYSTDILTYRTYGTCTVHTYVYSTIQCLSYLACTEVFILLDYSRNNKITTLDYSRYDKITMLDYGDGRRIKNGYYRRLNHHWHRMSSGSCSLYIPFNCRWSKYAQHIGHPKHSGVWIH